MKRAKISVPNKSTYSLIGDTSPKFLRIKSKEVIFQQRRNAQQQIRVYGFLIVNLIDICTAISQFAGKPGSCSSLGFHLFSDEASDVHSVLCENMCHRFPGLAGIINKATGINKKERGNLLSAYPIS